MKIFGRLSLAVGLTTVALGISLAPAMAAAPVLIKHCFVTEPKLMSKNASGTQIDYIIYGKKHAASITFAVGYQNSQQSYLRTVTDTGNFAPGAYIQHHLPLYSDVTYGGKQTKSCIPIRVKWLDATLWVAPSH